MKQCNGVSEIPLEEHVKWVKRLLEVSHLLAQTTQEIPPTFVQVIGDHQRPSDELAEVKDAKKLSRDENP